MSSVGGDSVYQCNTCYRKLRVPTNPKGLDVLQYCIITAGCKGKLHKLTLAKDIINTPLITPAVLGLQDWFQRAMIYNHTQTIPSTIWTVTHNLQSRPIVHTFVNIVQNGNIVLVAATPAQIIPIDANTTQLVFASVESGVAQFEALSTPTSIQLTTNLELLPPPNVQISTNTGLLTICTLAADPTIDLNITFVVPGSSLVTIPYRSITNIPSIQSPWSGISKVYINCATYHVRTVNIITDPNALSLFLSGAIPPSGGNFYVSSVSSIDYPPGSILVLGASEPFGTADRIYTQYADLSAENVESLGMLYSYGKIYATPNTMKEVYPPIIVVK